MAAFFNFGARTAQRLRGQICPKADRAFQPPIIPMVGNVASHNFNLISSMIMFGTGIQFADEIEFRVII
jgi:hypothetical protein